MEKKTIKPSPVEKKKDFVEDPWIRWNVKFHKLLSPEEIPGEIPKLEECLDEYLLPFTRMIKIRIRLSLKYTWNTFGKNPRSYILQVFLRPHPSKVNEPSAPVEQITIVKDDGRYKVIKGRNRKRSTKNTVKLTPPAT